MCVCARARARATLALGVIFVSCTFASEPYSTFFSSPRPSTFKLAQRYACVTLRAWSGFFQVPKDWEVGLGVGGDEFFFQSCQNSWIGRLFRVL
jgi:hypothetical protein